MRSREKMPVFLSQESPVCKFLQEPETGTVAEERKILKTVEGTEDVFGFRDAFLHKSQELTFGAGESEIVGDIICTAEQRLSHLREMDGKAVRFRKFSHCSGVARDKRNPGGFSQTEILFRQEHSLFKSVPEMFRFQAESVAAEESGFSPDG